MDKKVVTVPEDIHKRMLRYKKKTGVMLTHLVTKAVSEFLDSEDINNKKEAKK